MAKGGLSLQGSLSFTGMDRLLDSIKNPNGEVWLELKFGVDERNTFYLKGYIKTQVELVCQRCLQNVMYKTESQFLLSPVHNDEEVKTLASCYEPLLVTGEILLKTMIEDEILLSLPLIPLHDPSVCEVKLEPIESKKYKPNHPFAKLAELKAKKNS
jgi:uncharacterized protein